MITTSRQFDLGRDTTHIKDPRDAQRQQTTVEAILARFFHADPEQRRELQVLADEVGMGKTYIALGVAYTILQTLQGRSFPAVLDGCYQKVLILTPQNSALFTKWLNETGEFVSRCVRPEHQPEAKSWFKPVPIDRLDELVAELRRSGNGPKVLVASTSLFRGGKLRHYGLKRRWLLGILFRHWGSRFRIDQRERLLKGAPEDWPRDPYHLSDLDDTQRGLIPYSDEEALKALASLDSEELLARCREISEPFVRNRQGLFEEVGKRLVDLYRKLCIKLIQRALPLVVVDEAHNWKNGPENGTNGFFGFRDMIANRTRRILLLTATPFQLHPNEMLELLRITDSLAPETTHKASEERRIFLRNQREDVLRPVLKRSAEASIRYAKAWARLPPTVRTEELRGLWSSPIVAQTRTGLRRIASQSGVVSDDEMQRLISQAVAGIDPALREFFREALRLYTFNCDLSQELGEFVIRHRRRTEHRLFKVGGEFHTESKAVACRPDRHVLHPALGMDVRGDAELPHFLLMRCVSEMKWSAGRGGRSSLGSDLTGCWSTLLHSTEGKKIQRALSGSADGQRYLKILMTLVGPEQDANHPKVEAVANAVVHAWEQGEKSLIFCFRTNTAHRLREIVNERIRRALEEKKKRCLGGEQGMKTLRSRLTGRDRDLLPLGLDRVLWSFFWAWKDGVETKSWLKPDHLLLKERDIQTLARLALQHGMDLLGERPDRVFLHRSLECAMARRLLEERTPDRRWKLFLEAVADFEWIRHAYGVSSSEGTDEEGDGESAVTNERGVHSVYEIVEDEPSNERIRLLARQLLERREKAGRASILDAIISGPSLWLGPDPLGHLSRQRRPRGKDPNATLSDLHGFLAHLTMTNGEFDWEGRKAIFQALRRALLRESVLLRLLPEASDRAESSWGDLLVEAFFENLPRQGESMADRVAVFLEDLKAASGDIRDKNSARYSLFDATHLRDQSFVALVDGSTKAEQRQRIFTGFNTPLLPEVLVCTQVGQEGIDLHRHCRNVVHYDLAWNPAVMEQRTGRADRIGSKTFRERDLEKEAEQKPFLEIGVPFLAGTYDERMFEELRLRAQMFEVLTGGDLAVERNVEGRDELSDADGEAAGLSYVILPDEMVADLRVSLNVWAQMENL